jgi:hypothetical protein
MVKRIRCYFEKVYDETRIKKGLGKNFTNNWKGIL